MQVCWPHGPRALKLVCQPRLLSLSLLHSWKRGGSLWMLREPPCQERRAGVRRQKCGLWPRASTTSPCLRHRAAPLQSELGVGFHHRFHLKTGLGCQTIFVSHCPVPCLCFFPLPCYPKGHVFCTLKFHHFVCTHSPFPWEFSFRDSK